MRFTTLMGLATAAMAAMVSACSSAPPYEGSSLAGPVHGGSDDGSGGDATDDDPSDKDDSAGTGTTGQASTATKNACSAEKTQKTCFECCTAKAPKAVEIYTGALEGCLCQSPGTCKDACSATLCSGFKADTTCAECLRTAGTACEDTAFAACEKDSACAPMLTCADEAHCAAK